MEKTRIYHAFNGFLYSPIFLAERLGLFPNNTSLVYTGTDRGTIEALCSDSHSGDKNWFAICDPFSVDLNEALEHTNDDIRVVGSLINVIPLWIYNADPAVRPVRSESDLSRYRQQIKRLICYSQGTTGYLIGSRVRGIIGVQEPLIDKPFGEEFHAAVDNSTAVITADILRMVHYGLNKGNVVFSYPTMSPSELNPFLFTAILTLRSTVDSNLWAVLSVLGAIRSAIECLSVRYVEDRYINDLVAIYDSPKYGDVFSNLGITDANQKATLVRTAVSYAFMTEKIYSQYPRPRDEQWVLAWENARRTWHAHTKKDYATVEQKEEPIPTLLVKPGWKSDLAEYFKKFLYADSDRQTLPTALRAEFLTARQKLVLVFGWFLLAASALTAFFCANSAFRTYAAPSHERTVHMALLAGTLFCFALEGISFWATRKALLKLQDYAVEMTLWLLFLGGFITLASVTP